MPLSEHLPHFHTTNNSYIQFPHLNARTESSDVCRTHTLYFTKPLKECGPESSCIVTHTHSPKHIPTTSPPPLPNTPCRRPSVQTSLPCRTILSSSVCARPHPGSSTDHSSPPCPPVETHPAAGLRHPPPPLVVDIHTRGAHSDAPTPGSLTFTPGGPTPPPHPLVVDIHTRGAPPHGPTPWSLTFTPGEPTPTPPPPGR